jgi:hypothetical protein
MPIASCNALLWPIRPLRIEELAEVLTIRFQPERPPNIMQTANWRSVDARNAVLLACSSLISIVDGVDGSPVVQFSFLR